MCISGNYIVEIRFVVHNQSFSSAGLKCVHRDTRTVLYKWAQAIEALLQQLLYVADNVALRVMIKKSIVNPKTFYLLFG